MRYAYRLKGVDKKWVYTGEYISSYTDIRPGEYLFEVKSSYDGYLWSAPVARLVLLIRPPFWMTGWFIAITSLLLLAGVSLVIRMRFIGLQKEKYNIELEQRLLRSQMNPHFIFNSLTSIQNYMLGKHSAKASHYLAKFSRLLRMILENSRNSIITLEQEIQTLDHYLTLQKIRYEQMFDYVIHVDQELDPAFLRIPPMLTQPFVENAIEHGLKPAKEKKSLMVSFEADGEFVRITIEDNGIGIRQSRRLRKAREKGHQSLATDISQDRIQNMNRFGRQKIRLEIFDLAELEEGGRGTRVAMSLPRMTR